MEMSNFNLVSLEWQKAKRKVEQLEKDLKTSQKKEEVLTADLNASKKIVEVLKAKLKAAADKLESADSLSKAFFDAKTWLSLHQIKPEENLQLQHAKLQSDYEFLKVENATDLEIYNVNSNLMREQNLELEGKVKILIENYEGFKQETRAAAENLNAQRLAIFNARYEGLRRDAAKCEADKDHYFSERKLILQQHLRRHIGKRSEIEKKNLDLENEKILWSQDIAKLKDENSEITKELEKMKAELQLISIKETNLNSTIEDLNTIIEKQKQQVIESQLQREAETVLRTELEVKLKECENNFIQQKKESQQYAFKQLQEINTQISRCHLLNTEILELNKKNSLLQNNIMEIEGNFNEAFRRLNKKLTLNKVIIFFLLKKIRELNAVVLKAAAEPDTDSDDDDEFFDATQKIEILGEHKDFVVIPSQVDFAPKPNDFTNQDFFSQEKINEMAAYIKEFPKLKEELENLRHECRNNRTHNHELVQLKNETEKLKENFIEMKDKYSEKLKTCTRFISRFDADFYATKEFAMAASAKADEAMRHYTKTEHLLKQGIEFQQQLKSETQKIFPNEIATSKLTKNLPREEQRLTARALARNVLGEPLYEDGLEKLNDFVKEQKRTHETQLRTSRRAEVKKENDKTLAYQNIIGVKTQDEIKKELDRLWNMHISNTFVMDISGWRNLEYLSPLGSKYDARMTDEQWQWQKNCNWRAYYSKVDKDLTNLKSKK
jgi:hypothetical protein